MELVVRNANCNLCPLHELDPKPHHICIMNDEIEEVDVLLVSSIVSKTDDARGATFSDNFSKKLIRKIKDSGYTVGYTAATKCAIKKLKYRLSTRYKRVCSDTYLAKEIRQAKPKHIVCFGADAWFSVYGGDKFTKSRGNRHWSEEYNCWVYPAPSLISAIYNADVRAEIEKEVALYIEWMGQEEVQQFNPNIVVLEDIFAIGDLVRKCYGKVVACDIETNSLDAYQDTSIIRTIQITPEDDITGYVIPIRYSVNTPNDCYFGRLKAFYEECPLPIRKNTPVGLSYNESLEIKSKEDYLEKVNAPHYARDVFNDESVTQIMYLIEDLLHNSSGTVYHNGKFDRNFMTQFTKRLSGRRMKFDIPLMDTLHVAFLLNENRELKLKALITSELGIPTYDIGDKVTPDIDILVPYAGKDTAATILLYEKFSGILLSDGFNKLRKMYVKFMRKADMTYSSIEMRGWPVDLNRAKRYEKYYSKKSFIIEHRMKKFLLEQGFDKDQAEKLNLGSPPQVAEIIFTFLEHPHSSDKSIAFTAGGALSTKEDALFHLKEEPFVKELLELRGIKKLLSTYVLPMKRGAETCGRIRTSYKLAHAVTGRTASGAEGKNVEAMNLQNIPHGRIRNIVKAEEGIVLLEADLSQIELRVAGELSKDPLFLHAYANNIDLHALRGRRMLGLSEEEWEQTDKSIKKKARQDAKPVNFGFLYGMGAFKFRNYALMQYGVDFTMRECTTIRNQYFSDHYGLEPWYEKTEQKATRLGYVESLIGRRRHVLSALFNPEAGPEYRKAYSDAIAQAINSVVQSFAADIKMMALIEIEQLFEEKYKGIARLIGEIHDSILIECLEEYVEEIAVVVLNIMRKPKLLAELGVELSVPLDAEAKYGNSLGKVREIKA